MTCSHAHCNTPATVPSPLRHHSWYRRLHAWALAQGNARYDHAVADAKGALLGRLTGDVVEIGPGAGANLAYYAPGIQWTGIEPNLWAHSYLTAAASQAGIKARVIDGVAEALPLPDASVDAVVSTLVLCTVTDPAATLAEIRRVLKPGGRFVFIEHVAAEEGSWLRRTQRLLRRPQAWIGDGCQPDRNTLESIEAAGFAWVISCRDRMPVPLVSPHLLGYAIR